MFKQVNSYSNKKYGNSDNILKIYGISQNPNTKDYIIVLQDGYHELYCGNCDKKYTNTKFKWCRACQTSGNKQIDDFIQEMQLKIDRNKDIGFEWISYNQFDYIKEIGKAKLTTVYSAIWKDGPLDFDYHKWTRSSYRKVTLKYLHGSQNNANEFLNEV